MANIYTLANNNFFQNNTSGINDPDRFLGGSSVSSYHPYVKGYFYVFFQFPPIVNDYNSKLCGSNTLLSLCEGFTPPGDRQLKTEDVTGVGGIDASFVVGQTIDRGFSLMYRDVWGSPVFVYHRAWTSIIDPFLGGLASNSDLDFIPETYKGKVMVVQTKPKALNSAGNFSYTKSTNAKWKNDIIKVSLFDGVVPITDLNSVYDANINDNAIVRPSVQYRFDGKEYDETVPGVLDNAAALMKSLSISNRSSNNITKGCSSKTTN